MLSMQNGQPDEAGQRSGMLTLSHDEGKAAPTLCDAVLACDTVSTLNPQPSGPVYVGHSFGPACCRHALAGLLKTSQTLPKDHPGHSRSLCQHLKLLEPMFRSPASLQEPQAEAALPCQAVLQHIQHLQALGVEFSGD